MGKVKPCTDVENTTVKLKERVSTILKCVLLLSFT